MSPDRSLPLPSPVFLWLPGRRASDKARGSLSTAFALNAADHNPATRFPNSCPNRPSQLARDKTSNRMGHERTAGPPRARVASFKATQEKFERERQEYYATTLANAWSGFTQRTA